MRGEGWRSDLGMEVEEWALVAQMGGLEEVRHRRVREVSEARRVK